MAEATPGPYTPHYFDGNDSLTISSVGWRGPRTLARCDVPMRWDPENECYICLHEDIQEAVANCRLLAAAPDMRDALQAAQAALYDAMHAGNLSRAYHDFAIIKIEKSLALAKS